MVIDSKVIVDGAFEFDRTAVRSALDLALAEQREPPFHQIDSACALLRRRVHSTRRLFSSTVNVSSGSRRPRLISIPPL
ncbi:MAG: hypothetical protein J0I90_02260 [Nitrosospira sp.]|nr:hypothetical protein [Nitrosospira sp.]